MGNLCSNLRLACEPLDIHNEDVSQLIVQLRERPKLLCTPKPFSFLGVNDTALHLAAEHKLPEVRPQIFKLLGYVFPCFKCFGAFGYILPHSLGLKPSTVSDPDKNFFQASSSCS